jgi:hypothetical protein
MSERQGLPNWKDLHGCKAHPSEAIANLAMSTRGFQLRWASWSIQGRRPTAALSARYGYRAGYLTWTFLIGRAVLLGRVWGEAPRL